VDGESLEAFSRAQLRHTLDTTPLDEAGRAAVEDGIRRCYEAAELPWHGVVVWVASPLAGLMVSAGAGRRVFTTGWLRAAAGRLAFAVERVPVAGVSAVALLVMAGTVVALAGPALAAIPALGHSYGWPAILGAGPAALIARGLVARLRDRRDATLGTVNSVVGLVVTWSAWWLGLALYFLAWMSFGAAIALWLAYVEVDLAAVVEGALAALAGAVLAFVGVALDIWQLGRDYRRREGLGKLGGTLHTVITRPTALLPRAPAPPMITGVENQLNTAIEQAARDARRQVPPQVRQAIRETLSRVTGRPVHRVRGPGRWWVAVPQWLPGQYRRSELLVPLWRHDRLTAQTDALDQASRAGWWWPFPDFAVVSERPVEVHGERVGTEYRLHRDNGPAVRWRDGFALNFWHGTQLPGDFYDAEPTVRAIGRLRNTEVRRAAIERIGWLEVPTGQSAQLIHTDEHGANGIGPGTYEIRRKREIRPLGRGQTRLLAD
jgi:hypothetical protein